MSFPYVPLCPNIIRHGWCQDALLPFLIFACEQLRVSDLEMQLKLQVPHETPLKSHEEGERTARTEPRLGSGRVPQTRVHSNQKREGSMDSQLELVDFELRMNALQSELSDEKSNAGTFSQQVHNLEIILAAQKSKHKKEILDLHRSASIHEETLLASIVDLKFILCSPSFGLIVGFTESNCRTGGRGKKPQEKKPRPNGRHGSFLYFLHLGFTHCHRQKS